MRKILFSILVGISNIALGDTLNVFPEKPASLKSCYQAGQVWIRSQMWRMKTSKDLSAMVFNSQLSACTWKTPEASSFKWPDEHEYRSKAPYNNILALTPQGDWAVVSYSNDSLDAATYLRLSKTTSANERFDGASLTGYFFGFDFAAYDLQKGSRAFGAQTVSLSEQGASIQLDLLGSHEGRARLFLQSVKEAVAFDTQKKNWLFKKCLYQISPDLKNSLSAIVEKCHVNEAADVASLRRGDSQSRPDAMRTFRWDGVSYKEGEPTDWLAKRNSSPIKIPKLILTNSKSGIKEKDGIWYQTFLLTKTPQGRMAPVSSIQWMEISRGVESRSLSKINQALKSLAFDDSDLMLEPDINYEAKKPELRYGESISAVEFVSATEEFLTVAVLNTSMGYGMRSYDSKSYVTYSLTSGEVVMPATSLFKSKKALDLFSYWSTNFFKDKLDYLFPKRWMANTGKISTGFLTLIPVKEGIQVVVGDDSGGHYFEDVVGVVPYSMIPAQWMTSNARGNKLSNAPMVKPRLNCASELEQPEEKKICDLELASEYEAVLALWQVRLEGHAGNADEEDKISSEFMEFLGKLGQCADEKGCVKNILDEDKARQRDMVDGGH